MLIVHTRLWLFSIAAGALLLTRCAAPEPVTAPATPSQAMPVPMPTQSAVSNPDVLAACDTGLQARAMRDGFVPDWTSLGVNACYQLTLDLLPDEAAYTGTARVTFANPTGVALPDLVFRIYPNAAAIYDGALEIHAARVDGAPVTFESMLSDRTAVRLLLSRPLPAGAIAVVELTFEGSLPINFGTKGAYGIFNYSSAGPLIVMANWFPILAVWRNGEWSAAAVQAEGDAVVSETALYRVQIGAPEAWQVVATGARIDESRQAGRSILSFASGPARDFAVAASPVFEALESSVGGVRVAHWGLPDGESGWDNALDVARGSVEVFNERFGGYPYAELDVIAAPLQRASGVEYPGFILIGAGLYTGEAAETVLPVTVAHEVAHQWWYGVVGNDVLLFPWQDEALTSYSSFLYLETFAPGLYRGVLGFYRQRVGDYLESNDDEPIAQPLSAFRNRGEAYGAIVYSKGALFFDALREEIGDEAFFSALQAYYEQNQYTLAPPDALLAAFEKACGCPLDALYQEWGVAR